MARGDDMPLGFAGKPPETQQVEAGHQSTCVDCGGHVDNQHGFPRPGPELIVNMGRTTC